MALRFMRYSGSKLKYKELINSYINKSKKTTYIEPFVGSGAILFNLEKTFDRYIINDIDRNIVRMFQTFKSCSYQEYIDSIKFVSSTFGDIKNSKESYYKFRNWFNITHWNTESIEEGLFLHQLANSCINSFIRFGPNGMNQSFGNRFFVLNNDEFNKIHDILQRTEIYNNDYKNLLYHDACFFLDPPYFSQDSSYIGFTEQKFIEFLSNIKNIEYVYTDILNEHNFHLGGEIIREMISTAPSSNKDKNGNIEMIFSSI